MSVNEDFRKTDFRHAEREPTLGAFKYAGKTPILEWVDSGPKKPTSVELWLASMIAIALCLILLFTPSGLFSELHAELVRTVTFSGVLRSLLSLVVVIGVTILILKAVREYAIIARSRTKKFIDIDYEREYVKKVDTRFYALQKQVLDLLKENRELHESGAATLKTNNLAQTNSKDAVKDQLREASHGAPVVEERNPLEAHIRDVIESLENHIDMSDKKASNLLDTGTMYLRRGIYFYVASILVWQGVAQFRGVDQALIFGIVSCSFTFLVVEFLAAWFLKQYRNFNDSSMQFMKVKSVYDRYLLSYHALNNFSLDREDSISEARAMMLAALEKDASWPEPGGFKVADVNHITQMFESVGGLLDKTKDLKSKERGAS